MTVDEMIISLKMKHTLQGRTYSDVGPEEADAIIAALKAGQQMRQEILDYELKIAAAEDWDAATKDKTTLETLDEIDAIIKEGEG